MTERKTIKFAGREIDQNEFVRRAKAKAEEWMDYQGLKGDQRTDFINEFNNQLSGIVKGTYSVNDVGEIEGATDTGTQYYGEQTGSRKKNRKPTGGLIPVVSRYGFNPSGNVATYLNGIAGAMNEQPKEETKTKKGKAWDSNSMARHISNYVFNKEEFDDELAKQWADATGDVIGENGLRGITNRNAAIKEQLQKYQSDLINGVYDISDEDKAAELDKITKLTGDNLSDWERNKLAPWMSNLLFTGERYLTKEDQAKLQEEKTIKDRTQQLNDYISGKEGVVNPYEKGTPEFEAAETKRKEYQDEKFKTDFYNKDWSYNAANDGTYEGVIIRGLKPEIFNPSSGDMFTNDNIKYFIDNGLGIVTDNNGYDVSGGWEMFHNDYTGWGENDTELDRGYRYYFNILPNDYKPDDTSGGRGSSNRNLLAQAALTYSNALYNNPEYKKYRTLDTKEMILPFLIDWKTGKTYVYSQSNDNRRGKFTIKNLKDIINRLPNDGRADLLERYKQYINNIPKAQDGIKLSKEEVNLLTSPKKEETNEVPAYKPVDNPFAKSLEEQEAESLAQYNRDNQLGAEKVHVNELKNKTEFSTTDWMRLGTVAADLSAAILSLTGVGSTAGAVVGAGSSLTQFGLDLSDRTVGFWQALGGLGVGLAMDAFTLIPGAGAAGGIAKAAKTITKIAPLILSAFQVIGNADGAIKTLDKITKGDFKKVTVGEWREFARAINGLTNTTVYSKTAYDRKIGKFKKFREQDKEYTLGYKDQNGKDQTIKLTGKQIQDINAVGKQYGNEKAIGALKAATGKDDITTETFGLNYEGKGILGRFKNQSLKAEGKGTPVFNDKLISEADKLNAPKNAFERRFGNDYINATGGKKAYYARAAAREEALANELKGIQAVDKTGRAKIIEEALNKETESSKVIKEMTDARKAVSESNRNLSTAQNAYNEASKRPFNPNEQANIEGRKAKLQNLIESNKDIIARGKDAKTNLSGVSTKNTETKGKITELTHKQTLVENRWIKAQEKLDNLVKVGNDKEAITKAQKLVKGLETQHKNLTKQLQSIKDERTALAKDAQNWRQVSTLSDKALKQNEKATSLINQNDARLAEITTQSEKYNALRAAKKAHKQAVSQRNKKITPEQSKSYFSKINNVKDSKYEKLLEQTTGKGVEGATQNITDAKRANFQKFLSDLNIGEKRVTDILKDKEFMEKARAIYHFKKGGNVQKLQEGKKVTPSGAVNQKSKKNESEWYDKINQYITGLEEQSYRTALDLNSAIVDQYKKLKATHTTPNTLNYKTHSSKDLTDSAQEVRNMYNEAGAQAAKGTSDQAQANAYRLLYMTKGEEAARPYMLQASQQDRADVDKATEVANANKTAIEQTADRNKAADTAKYNQGIMADIQGLHDLGTKNMQHSKAIEMGLAESAITAYNQAQNNAINNDPTVVKFKPRYEELARKRKISELTDEEEKEYQKLVYDIRQAQYNAALKFKSMHREPNTRPYGISYTLPSVSKGEFDYGNGFDYGSGFFASGGKMEAAEREKTRREYVKLFHDTQKLLLTQSNKKLKSSGLSYFKKLMQG